MSVTVPTTAAAMVARNIVVVGRAWCTSTRRPERSPAA